MNHSNERYELLKKAVQDMKENKLSLRAAAKKYSLPRSTISDHFTGKCTGRHGKQPVLSEIEENVIAAHAAKVAEWGFPLSRIDLRLVVKMYLDKEGRQVALFKDNLPGEEWVNGFLNRHPDLRLRMSRNITVRRAKICVDDVSKFFANLKTTIEGIPSSHILNYDETNLSDDPGSVKCIFRRGTKYPERIMNSSKSAVSIMFAGTAAGELLAPYVCYKAERMYDSWITGGPPGTRYNRSKSGWIDEATFYDWFKTIVLPWAKGKTGTKVVLGDNLSTHFSLEVVKLCEENSIRFVCLPPNATHLMQPLDVAFFRPLKGAWRAILSEWKMEADRRLTSVPKHTFPTLLRKLCDAIEENRGKNLQAGFRACGIVPLDSTAVLKKLPTAKPSPTESPTKKTKELVGEAVVNFLANLRHGNQSQKAPRKKKVNVPPGLSISVEDIDVDGDLQSKPSTSVGKRANKAPAPKSTKRKRVRTISTSSEEEERFSVKDMSDELVVSEPEGPPEQDAELVFKDPVAGDWLLIKFAGKRSVKYFVGVVESVIPNVGLQINFAKNVGNFVFKWPEQKDASVVDYDQVVRNLGLPTFNYKNDRLVSFSFKYSFDGYTIF